MKYLYIKILCLIWALIITGCVSTENSIQTVAYDDSRLALEKAIELGLQKARKEYGFNSNNKVIASRINNRWCVSIERLNHPKPVTYDDSRLPLEKAIALGLRKVKEEYRFTQAYNLTASLSDRCCFVSIYFLPRSPGNDLMVSIYDDGTVTITPGM